MTQKDLADFFGVSDPTISRWESADRQPPLAVLPAFDRLAGQPRGHVLRRAGYVTDDADIDLEAAIFVAPDLDDAGRELLAHTYEVLRKRSN
jgi:transcriptional regulator with XRE-family HTH domain